MKARSTARLLAVTGFALGVLASTRPAFAQGKKEADLPDTIVTKDKKVKAEVVKEEAKEVVFKTSGDKQQRISWEEVVRIDYKDFPPDLSSAEAALERRDYVKAESAADEAVKSCGDGRAKDLFLARALVAKARALRGENSLTAAAECAQRAIDSASGSKWAADASIERVAALALAGSDDCAKAGTDAETLADTFGDEFKYDVYIHVGAYFEKKGNVDEAKKRYAFIQNSQRQEMQDRAQLGLARLKLLENNPDGAKEAFEKILRAAKDSAAIAGASVGLGDSVLGKLKGAKDSDKPNLLREALELYIRGVVMAYPTGNSPTDNHELTLRRAADTCEKIVETIPSDKNEKNIGARRFYMDYARKLLEDLIRTYPNASGLEDLHKHVGELRQKSAALSGDKPAEKPAEK